MGSKKKWGKNEDAARAVSTSAFEASGCPYCRRLPSDDKPGSYLAYDSAKNTYDYACGHCGKWFIIAAQPGVESVLLGRTHHRAAFTRVAVEHPAEKPALPKRPSEPPPNVKERFIPRPVVLQIGEEVCEEEHERGYCFACGKEMGDNDLCAVLRGDVLRPENGERISRMLGGRAIVSRKLRYGVSVVQITIVACAKHGDEIKRLREETLNEEDPNQINKAMVDKALFHIH